MFKLTLISLYLTHVPYLLYFSCIIFYLEVSSICLYSVRTLSCYALHYTYYLLWKPNEICNWYWCWWLNYTLCVIYSCIILCDSLLCICLYMLSRKDGTEKRKGIRSRRRKGFLLCNTEGSSGWRGLERLNVGCLPWGRLLMMMVMMMMSICI